MIFRRPSKTDPERETADGLAADRRRMLRMDLAGRDITNEAVVSAMATVPRERFLRPEDRHLAYKDHPVPIGHQQTISQPYIVALTTQLARPRPTDRALDVGTGSGYQAAVLYRLVDRVYSMEIVPELATAARARLADLGYDNVEVREGDASLGWPEAAPFDIIVSAAAPQAIPPALTEQLAPGGRLVCPVGGWQQRLVVLTRRADGDFDEQDAGGVRFVPMTGGHVNRCVNAFRRRPPPRC